ncbi:MAG: alkaline phosphatase family protein, partial [Solirubrobacterales bacterium]
MSAEGRKLCLIFVDALRTDKLQETIEAGNAPNFGALVERGHLIEDCVSGFPSVTPVCTSEIATGTSSERHCISGMNWYHRAERRYVEYGSSFEATRAFGLFRATYDIVYNMNMAHLSHEVETFFESLGDAGIRTACTPFLIYRGRKRHEVSLEGLLKRGATAAGFRHAVYGPDELFYGELFGSRPVPCKPTLARPGTRDEYSACVSKELVADNAYDFLLFSLPDNDHHSHRFGPDATPESIAHADNCLGELVEACGGMDEFLRTHAVIMVADHAQTPVTEPYDMIATLEAEWRVLQPSSDSPETAELAVSPTSRAGHVYVLTDKEREVACHADVRLRLKALKGTDLVCWLAGSDGQPVVRREAGSPVADDPGVEAVVETARGELRFRPGRAGKRDRRGKRWHVEGELAALGLSVGDGTVESATYPDGLGRLWSALVAPHSGDVIVSLAEGYECVDWGQTSHVGGGSHGSLLAGDSLCPLLLVGFDPGTENAHEQWRITDVAPLVRS